MAVQPTRMRKLLFSFFLILSVQSRAQDSVSRTWEFAKQLSFWNEWQATNYTTRISMPSVLRYQRRIATSLPIVFDSLTDNPLQHGAAYVAFSTRTSYQQRVWLFADLYAEHRGTSYGIFDQSNIIIFPVIRIEARDTVGSGKKAWALQGQGGAFLNDSLDAGLMIYNVDAQGIKLIATRGNFSSQFSLYGDLQNGIGLQIDDLYAISVNWKHYGTSIGASINLAKTYFQNFSQKSYFNLFARQRSKNLDVYGQIGFRAFEYPAAQFFEHTALLAGAAGSVRMKRVHATARAELRHYGSVYNFGRHDNLLRYRQPATDIFSMYANTIGKYLYPLRRVDAPFSQWAVATEYVGYNVSMAGLTADVSYRLSQKLDLFFHPDFNYVLATHRDSQTSAFLYPFFDAGVLYQPAKNASLALSITNKSMNLDLSYPTAYLLRQPCFKLALKAGFFDTLR